MLKNRRWKRLVLAAGAILTMAMVPPCPGAQVALEGAKKIAQDKASSEDVQKITASVVAEKLQEIGERIKAAEAEQNEETAARLGVTVSHLQERAAKLKELEALYQRLLTALKKRETLEKETSFLNGQIKDERGSGLSQEPPYSLSFYDVLLDQLNAAQTQQETADLAVKFAERGLEESRARLEKAQRSLRSLREESEGGDAAKTSPKQKMALESAQLEELLAQAEIDFQRLRHENLLREKALADLRTRAARQNIVWVRSHLHFDASDLAKQLNVIEQRRSELQTRLNSLIGQQGGVEITWLEAQRAMETAREEGDRSSAKARLEEREAWRQTYQRALEQTEDMLQLLNQQEQAWKNRYALLKGNVSSQQLEAWQEEAENRIRNTQRVLQLQQSGQANLQSEIVTLETQLSEPGSDAKVKPFMENRLRALRQASERNIEYLSALLVTQQLHRRLVDEIGTITAHIPLSQRLSRIAVKIGKVWNFEIFAIDDKSVTVKKVTFAVFILVIGIASLKFAFSVLRKRILPRLQIKATTAAALEKMLYYFALLLLILFALRMVNIPLTAFAFLGGAIAIGVGFGAQNLINNFISGFIMMAERPIKIGDLVEVDGNFALVEEIGARCTRIRTGANVHILVPNSSFLEKNIINWTLSDQMVRTNVTVGVVYGSPVHEVRRLLLQAVSEQRRVLRAPEPFVLFNDFGDNALIFDVYFWIQVTKLMDRRLIESEVRFRIEELFRKAGIVIAFPQRDIHLDTQRPLELRILGDKPPGPQ